MAEKTWVDVAAVEAQLAHFFEVNSKEINAFGSRVNQTFEAFVFAQTVAWFKERGWAVKFVHPSSPASQAVKLKFSTKGQPANYTFAEVNSPDGSKTFHVRHQLRVATKHHAPDQHPPANVCLDVAVIALSDLSAFGSDDFVPNEELITFGEAKHMSAFAELVASFVGLVHELQPRRLKCVRRGPWKTAVPAAPAPFLFVSGVLYLTAQGIKQTIQKRKLDVDIFDRVETLAAAFALPTKPAPKKSI